MTVFYTLVGVVLSFSGANIESVELTRDMPSLEVCKEKMTERRAHWQEKKRETYQICVPIEKPKESVLQERKV